MPAVPRVPAASVEFHPAARGYQPQRQAEDRRQRAYRSPARTIPSTQRFRPIEVLQQDSARVPE